MKKTLLLAVLAAAGCSAISAQTLKSDYVSWPNSSGLATYVNDWVPGEQLFDDENFFISRVKPKTRFRNLATQINESLTEDVDKKCLLWIPVNYASNNGVHTDALPNGLFDSEVFSMWSYVTHFGDWISPHGWVPGSFADVAHKNGCAVSGVASIPNATLSGNWLTCLTDMGSLSAEKLGRFLYYHGVDGLGYNSEFYSEQSIIDNLNVLHADLGHWMADRNPLWENIWYTGTTDNGKIYGFYDGLNSKNTNVFGDSENPRTSLFLNYNWNNTNKIKTSLQTAETLGRNPLDLYAGMDMQGGIKTTTEWQKLLSTPYSLGMWGAHSQNMLWAARAGGGSSALQKQQYYQTLIERYLSNGKRNPAVKMDVLLDKTATGTANFHGFSTYMSARSPLSWDLGTEPFITYFNLGNGTFFNWEGQRVNDNEWYNIGVQDYLPTWRYWFSGKFLGKETADVVENGLAAEFTWDDAYFGGSCLKVAGSTQKEYLHLFKTDFELKEGDEITLRYKLVNGHTGIALAMSKVGNESDKYLHYFHAKQTEPDDAEWTTMKLRVSANDAVSKNFIGNVAVIALRFADAEDLDLRLGEFSIVRNAAPTPATPNVQKTKLLAYNIHGVDGKIIFGMPNDKAAGEPVYNLDVNTSMFKLYGQQEGDEPVLMGVTTSWAGLCFSIPCDPAGAEKMRLGVSAVSLDFKSESPIAWSEYMNLPEYAGTDEVAIDKSIIKPNEDFRVYYIDPKHADADWKLYDQEHNLIASSTESTELEMTAGVPDCGLYDVVINEGTESEAVYKGFVQVSNVSVGSMPKIESLTINGEEPKSDISIMTRVPMTFGYTGREADGTASRALGLDASWIGCRVGDVLGDTNNKSFSIAAWVKFQLPENASASFVGIEDRSGSWPGNNWGFFWSNIGPDGYLSNFSFTNKIVYYYTPDASKFPEGKNTSRVLPGVWTHIALTFEYNEEGKFRSFFYINGERQVPNGFTDSALADRSDVDGWSPAGPVLPSNHWICLGGNRGEGGMFNDGLIDDFQIWNKAMTEEDVKTSMKGFTAGNVPEDVLAYWSFENEPVSVATTTNAGQEATLENVFKSEGSNADAWACQFKMVTLENASKAAQIPQAPKFDAGSPMIAGTAFKVETLPTWSAPRMLVDVKKGTATEGEAEIMFVKAGGDRTVQLTLANSHGSDTRTYPVIAVALAVEGVNVDGDVTVVDAGEGVVISFQDAGTYDITVCDMQGRLAAQKKVTAAGGDNAMVTLSASGAYIVRITRDGRTLRTVKLMKK